MNATPAPGAPNVPMKTALLVEDEPSTLRFYTAGLKGLQEFRLLAAQNGLEALEVLQAEAVDVVVTDLNMPVLDGYGLIAILAERYPSLPIIVITSVAEPEQLNQVMELGVLRVIPKPPRLSMLMEAIRAAVAAPSPGMTRGLGLPSILQLLNWERRSATLTVRGAEGTGYLYVREGELIHAAVGKESGLLAAYRLLSWEGIQVEFVFKCKVRATIDLPLPEVLMNQALFRDEQALERDKRRTDMWHG